MPVQMIVEWTCHFCGKVERVKHSATASNHPKGWGMFKFFYADDTLYHMCPDCIGDMFIRAEKAPTPRSSNG